MKSYGQFCSLAKSLDIVGDRWTLLIIRELVTQGPCRYTDLANGVPGIASNLLSERLRSLEEHGVVTREAAPSPVATTLFHLTERGHELEPALAALARWGIGFVEGTPPADEAFHPYWFPYSVGAFLHDRPVGSPPVTVQLRTSLGDWVVSAHDGGTDVVAGTTDSPDVTFEGHPTLVIGFLSGSHTLEQARAAGLTVTGEAVLATFPWLPGSQTLPASDSVAMR